MSGKTASERFTAALSDFLDARAHRQYAVAGRNTVVARKAVDAENEALARLEDAFNDAVDKRVQQALAYDRSE